MIESALPAIHPLLPMTGAALAVAVLVPAAMHKLVGRERFAADFAAYNLLPALAVPAARALPLAELAAAAALLSPWRGAGAGVAATLFMLYAAAMAVNLRRGRQRIDCGCGGLPTPLSWWLVARNVALAGAALMAAWPRTTTAAGWSDFALMTLAVAALAALHGAGLQLLRNPQPTSSARSPR